MKILCYNIITKALLNTILEAEYMSIGTTIKKLRREKDMTQEQLAEYLGITANAVSQWECDRTAPDISQLPVLAYILEVSTDEILGVDARKYKEAVYKIIEEQSQHYASGNFEKCVEILRKGLSNYPKSYLLMAKLAHSLSCLGGHDKEVISLCTQVIDGCTDNEIRDCAFQDLIYNHKNGGRIDKAIQYAKKMSHTWVSQEEMMLNLLTGKEEIDQRMDYIKFCSNRLMMSLNFLSKQTDYYTIEERIALAKQSAAVAEILYPDGDYHYVACLALRAYEIIAKLYAQLNDVEETLYALEKMCEFTIHFDTYDENALNTSPAVRGYRDGGWIPDKEGNRSFFVLNKIENERLFDFIRDEQRYHDVVKNLKENV